MGRVRDMTGLRIGRLTVVCAAGATRYGWRWKCKCDCGAEVVMDGIVLRRDDTKSCGCWQRETAKRAGDRVRTHGMTGTRTYNTWKAMVARCTNPKAFCYRYYGGAGITVCERWLASFENFQADMGERPEGKTLDRWPNPAGNYEPDNCRWATPLEQRHNRRTEFPWTNEVAELRANVSAGERLP